LRNHFFLSPNPSRPNENFSLTQVRATAIESHTLTVLVFWLLSIHHGGWKNQNCSEVNARWWQSVSQCSRMGWSACSFALTDIDLTDLLHDQRSSQKGLFKKPDWDIAGQSYERAGKWQIYSRLRASVAVNVQYSTQQLHLRLVNRTSSQSKHTQKRPRLCSRQMRKCFFARYSLVYYISANGWLLRTHLAGKAMESAALILAQNLHQPDRAADAYRRASELFVTQGNVTVIIPFRKQPRFIYRSKFR
jgi:hypothetical protein